MMYLENSHRSTAKSITAREWKAHLNLKALADFKYGMLTFHVHIQVFYDVLRQYTCHPHIYTDSVKSRTYTY